MQRFGEAASVGKAMTDEQKPKAQIQPLGYALPALGVGLGARSMVRGARADGGAASMQRKATEGLRNADTGMAQAVSNLNRAKKEPTSVRMGPRKAVRNRKIRVKQISHWQNVGSANRGVELAERNILTAAQRYQAVQRQIPKMLSTGARLKRGALGAGLVGLGTLGAVSQRKKEKTNAQVW